LEKALQWSVRHWG